MQAFVRGQKSKLADICPSNNSFMVGVGIDDPARRTFDVACFGVDEQEKLSDDRYMIFFNQTASPCGGLSIQSSVAGDLQTFAVNLDRLPKTIKKLVFTVTVDTGAMSHIQGGYLRLATNQDVMRFSFRGADFGAEKAVMVAEIYFKDLWRIAAVGQGFAGGLSELLRHFGGQEAASPAPPPYAPPPFAPPVMPPSSPSPSNRGSKMPIFLSKAISTRFLKFIWSAAKKFMPSRTPWSPWTPVWN